MVHMNCLVEGGRPVAKRLAALGLIIVLSVSLLLAFPQASFAGASGRIEAWGRNDEGQCDVPSPNSGFTAVSAGYKHSLGLKSDGSVVGWGFNLYGQCNVPAPNSGFVAVSAGFYHSLGLKLDGSVVGWGYNGYGQCNAPSPNSDFTAVAGGEFHSLGLKSNGTVVAWGDNGDGQCNVPSPNSGFTAVAAGFYHSLGLKSDGSVVAWGDNFDGQCNVPAPNSDFTAVAAGFGHSLGLKSDGSVVGWGFNAYHQCNVPAPNSGFTAVAADYCHSLGLKSDGTVAAWGFNLYGQCNVPAPNSGFTAVAAGNYHSLAIRCPPVIAGCHPTSVVQGHTANVDITGSNTNFKEGTSVAQFSGTGITVNSTHVTDSNHAMANITVAPDAPVGYRNVNVLTGGETPLPLENVFSVEEAPLVPPRLDSLDPTSGTVGTHVTLSGEHFGAAQGDSYVTFNGTEAYWCHSWSDGMIVCQVPSGATSGPVTVTTPAGTSNGIEFTVEGVGSPRIKDCDPRKVYQGQKIELHMLGADTHFANGVSTAVISGEGINVESTYASDSTHATAHITVGDNAAPGTREVNVVTGSETPVPLKNVFTVLEKHDSPPEITSDHPGAGSPGMRVSVVGKRFGEVRGSSMVTFNGTPVTNYISWTDHEVVLSVPFGATTGPVKVVTPWGDSTGHTFTVTDMEFYFAEGTCRPGFQPYLTVQNPGNSEADVKITYMKGDGTTSEQAVTVPAHSRSTVAARDTLGEGDDPAHDFSARVECTNNQQIIVERPMYFSYGAPQGLAWTGGHDVMGALSAAESFYFAEGTCRPGFQPYLTIQNPGNSEADVKITYMKGDGTTSEQAVTVPAHSRSTVAARDALGEGDDPAHDFSAKVESANGADIVVERPMYFSYGAPQGLAWTGGSDVVGALAPAESFYFAEGTCRPGFDPYLTIQNPTDVEAEVVISYMTGDAKTREQTVDVPAESRSTVAVRDFLGSGDSPAYDFSAKVESTNNVDIVAERPMYFNYNSTWPGGHDVMGALSAASGFYFAEGTCRPGFDPYLTIQNPGLADAQVKITYMKGDGATSEQIITVPAHSRYTAKVSDTLGVGDDVAHDFSAKVECFNNKVIIVERPMYFNFGGAWPGGHNVVGFSP